MVTAPRFISRHLIGQGEAQPGTDESTTLGKQGLPQPVAEEGLPSVCWEDKVVTEGAGCNRDKEEEWKGVGAMRLSCWNQH